MSKKDKKDAQAKLADDLMVGADLIAEYVYGSPKDRRKIYMLSYEDQRALGLFRIGKMICARKSTINKRITAKEEGGL